MIYYSDKDIVIRDLEERDVLPLAEASTAAMAAPHTDCNNDDDLVLYLYKKLR